VQHKPGRKRCRHHLRPTLLVSVWTLTVQHRNLTLLGSLLKVAHHPSLSLANSWEMMLLLFKDDMMWSALSVRVTSGRRCETQHRACSVEVCWKGILLTCSSHLNNRCNSWGKFCFLRWIPMFSFDPPMQIEDCRDVESLQRFQDTWNYLTWRRCGVRRNNGAV